MAENKTNKPVSQKISEGELEGRSVRERDQLANTVAVLTDTVRVADSRGRDGAVDRFLRIVDQGNIDTKIGDTDVSVPVAAVADLKSAQIAEANIAASLEIKVHRENNTDKSLNAKQEGGWKGLFGPQVSFSATQGISDSRKRSSDMSSTMDVNISMRETEAPEGQLKLQDIFVSAATAKMNVAAEQETAGADQTV